MKKTMTSKPSYRIGIDIGGTFTDFMVIDDNGDDLIVEKCLTTPNAPEQGVFDGLDRLAMKVDNLFSSTTEMVHATTLVTNVIIERKGAITGLLTTNGFRDILEMRREVRYFLYDIFIRFPEPLVPRRLRFGIPERVLADGEVMTPLNEEAVRTSAYALLKEDVSAVAVCFLHSYRNPIHEKKAGKILSEIMPNAVVSLSHEIYPEPKEYERTSTTVVDAYVKKIAAGYLEGFSNGISQRGYKENLYIMMSNGGTASVDTAKKFPIQILESGPAAGVEAACFFGRLTQTNNLLAFVMGGTTAKLCIVQKGRATRTRSFEVDRVHRFQQGSGIPIAIPVYDLLELGAGGGSIARVNNLGLIEVGPESAGANPGPACYGFGGNSPTVTDADLVLGYLNADYFLGGSMQLDLSLSKKAIKEKIVKSTDLSTLEAAAGIHDLVNETMAAAARVYIAEKALAAHQLTLVASGGAGPVHATSLARRLGCPKVIVPPNSGVLSAMGLLAAPLAFERSRSIRELLTEINLAKLEKIFKALQREIEPLMPKSNSIEIQRSLDMRYAGQDFPLEIILDGSCNDTGKDRWKNDFEKNYESFYGRVDSENPIEIASARLAILKPSRPPQLTGKQVDSDGVAKGERSIFISVLGERIDVPVFERNALRIGQVIKGPAIVEERESTTLVGLKDFLTVDTFGCLILDIAKPN